MRACLFLLTISPFISLCLSVPSPLPSHLHVPTTLYRAVTGDQIALATDIYPIGKAPTAHRNTTSDFSQIGALYVFADRERAVTYGACFANLHPTYKKWYLVVLSYIPNEHTNDIGDLIDGDRFHVADKEWEEFIRDNYMHRRPQHGYNIVEGPYSYGADGTDEVKVWLDPETGELVWQAGFIGQEALQTLTVEELSLHDATDDPEFNLLEPFSPSGQQLLEGLAFEGFITSKCMQTSPPTG
ncbi:hypothetical protein F5887DRAFT_919306 [Amanita rubescens]|nr:hypothetical protein F5887DRAFT_919306 [Amanita rubescens]